MALAAYDAVRLRIEALVTTANLGVPVPGCPAWHVREVVAHLAGLCEDWVNHRLDGYASEQWTAAHIARFADCPLDEIVERWQTAAMGLAHLADDPVMGSPVLWALRDAICHEADLRGGLAYPFRWAERDIID